MRTVIVAIAMTVACFHALPAQTPGAATTYLSSVAGVGSIDGKHGFDVGLGGAVAWRALKLSVVGEAHIYLDDDGSYSWYFSSAGTECRRTGTGVTATNRCDPSGALFGVHTDLSAAVPLTRGALVVGGGYRVGDAATPYATVGYGVRSTDRSWDGVLRGVAGRRLLQIQVVASMRVTMRRAP